MKSSKKHFCNCLLKNHREHPVAVDKEDKCVYCGHYAIYREETDSDKRCLTKHGKELDRLKREYLEMMIKDKRHGEKCQ